MRISLASLAAEKDQHIEEIDFIKALAVIAAIILHTIPPNVLLKLFAPFHIWQAIPIFMMIAGITSALSSIKNNSLKLSRGYSKLQLNKSFKRIIIPFSVIWLFEIVVLIWIKEDTEISLATSYIAGGFGPGSYFTPIYVQHLIAFPLILCVINKLEQYNQHMIIGLLFCISLLLEWLCIMLNIPVWLYRLLYIRYFFAVILGIYLVKYQFNSRVFLFFTLLLSIAYITITSYLHVKWIDQIIYPSWEFQHAPAYFFTAFIIILLWKSYPSLRKAGGNKLTKIGKASYHIYLCQMVYFTFLPHEHIANIFATNNKIIILLALIIANLSSCLLFGYLFFKTHTHIDKFIEVRFADMPFKHMRH